MKKIASALLLSAVISAPALAATDFYVGVKAGSAEKNVNNATDTNTAFGVFGGYSFNQNFAVELGYTDLGKAQSDTIKFNTWDVSAVGSYPFNDQFSVYGKLGVASTKEDGFGSSVSRSAATYGLGGQFNVTPVVGIRAGWDRYSFGGGIFKDGTTNLYSVAALFKF